MKESNRTNLSIELVSRERFPLVKKFYQDYYPSGKPNKAEPLWILKYSEIICALRLKEIECEQLLTGVVTHPNYRDQGFGGYFLSQLQETFMSKPTYCFADITLEHFYNIQNFNRIEIGALPLELRSRFNRYQSSRPSLIPMHYKYAPALKS